MGRHSTAGSMARICGRFASRPRSVLHLCPCCSQERTLLLGEGMDEQLLLRPPHRQFVFTLPKVLRALLFDLL